MLSRGVRQATRDSLQAPLRTCIADAIRCRGSTDPHCIRSTDTVPPEAFPDPGPLAERHPALSHTAPATVRARWWCSRWIGCRCDAEGCRHEPGPRAHWPCREIGRAHV